MKIKLRNATGKPGKEWKWDCPSIASTDWYSFPILAGFVGFLRHCLLFHLGTSLHFPGTAKPKSTGSDNLLLETVVLQEDKVGFGKMKCFCLLKPISGLFHLIHFHIISKLIKFVGLQHWARIMSSPELGHRTMCLNLFETSSSNMPYLDNV